MNPPLPWWKARSKQDCQGELVDAAQAAMPGPMRAVLRWLGTILLFLAAGFCFLPTIIPPFLDRIYYQGPASDHFDGERFVNPDGPVPGSGSGRNFFSRWTSSEERTTWPRRVAVIPTVPPERVEGAEMRVTWIGHSTALIQTQGLNILTDPMWSDVASPFPPLGPNRVRAPGVRFEDLPRIDLVLVSHNHYDHLDLPSLRRLWQRDRPLIVTSLGNDSVIGEAGAPAIARDWGETVSVRSGVEVMIERNHHWGSRWMTDRNRALWSGFTIRLPGGNIFFAGDTGWGDGTWVREAARHGPFRLALIPIGAYEPRDFMRTHHVNPEEAVAIFEALDPARALGIHWGTFQLTFEPIDQPWQRLTALKRARGIAADRFVALPAGASFSVPTLAPAAR